jgi:hypothetical protein
MKKDGKQNFQREAEKEINAALKIDQMNSTIII